MWIFKMHDGSLIPAPDDFDPDKNVDMVIEHPEIMEVLFVSKVYVKQVKLVLKPAKERVRIRQEEAASEQPVEEAPAPKKRRKK